MHCCEMKAFLLPLLFKFDRFSFFPIFVQHYNGHGNDILSKIERESVCEGQIDR